MAASVRCSCSYLKLLPRLWNPRYISPSVPTITVPGPMAVVTMNCIEIGSGIRLPFWAEL